MWLQVPILVGTMGTWMYAGEILGRRPRLALIRTNGWWVGNEGYILGRREGEGEVCVTVVYSRRVVPACILCRQWGGGDGAASELGKLPHFLLAG